MLKVLYLLLNSIISGYSCIYLIDNEVIKSKYTNIKELITSISDIFKQYNIADIYAATDRIDDYVIDSLKTNEIVGKCKIDKLKEVK